MSASMMGISSSLGPCKLQIANLHPNVLEEDLMDIFKPFGEVDFLMLTKDETGTSKGMGFVQYKSTSCAMQAIQQLNNLDLAGQKLQVRDTCLKIPKNTVCANAICLAIGSVQSQPATRGTQLLRRIGCL